MTSNFVEGLKEVLRLSIIAVLPVLIEALTSGTLEWKVILVAFAIAFLKGIDKWVHLSDIETPLDLRFIK